MLRDLATMKPSKSSIHSGVVEAGCIREIRARSRQIANLDVKKVG